MNPAKRKKLARLATLKAQQPSVEQQEIKIDVIQEIKQEEIVKEEAKQEVLPVEVAATEVAEEKTVQEDTVQQQELVALLKEKKKKKL